MDGPQIKTETLSALDALRVNPIRRKTAPLTPDEKKLEELLPKLLAAKAAGTSVAVLCDVLFQSEGIKTNPSALTKRLNRRGGKKPVKATSRATASATAANQQTEKPPTTRPPTVAATLTIPVPSTKPSTAEAPVSSGDKATIEDEL